MDIAALGTRALEQITYYRVGELGAGRGAAHVPGPDALPDGAAQGCVDTQSYVCHAHVLQHPDCRPNDARWVGHGQSPGDRVVDAVFGVRVVVPTTVTLAIVFAARRAIVAHRTEHHRPGTVRGGRHRGRAAGQHAARRAGQRPVQARRE